MVLFASAKVEFVFKMVTTWLEKLVFLIIAQFHRKMWILFSSFVLLII